MLDWLRVRLSSITQIQHLSQVVTPANATWSVQIG
jgi:hypothetical protein